MDPEQAYVAAGVVRGLVEVVTRAGVDRDAFLADAGLNHAELNAPQGRLAYPQLALAVELALERTGDELLGLHWAASLTERTFVPVAPLLSHCANLAESLQLLARYFHFFTNRVAYSIECRGDDAHVVYHPILNESPRLHRFNSEMLIGGLHRFVTMFDPQRVPGPASFGYAAQNAAHSEAYEAFFGAPVLFEQPATCLRFDAELLRAPSPQRDDEVRDALQTVVEQRLQRIEYGTPWRERVRTCLADGHGGAMPQGNMESVARMLAVSVRTLRRRLSEENCTFDEVLSEARCQAAKRWLQDPGLSIQEVAFRLGFADASAFHRAFKRWTGTTPKTYRDQHLTGSSSSSI